MTTCQRRNTRQRQIVLEALRATCEHPTAGELYKTVRERMPRISLGTVYRNLEILQETGQAVRLAGCSGQEARYDGRCDPHLHLVCGECGGVRDLDTVLPVLDDLLGTYLCAGVFTMLLWQVFQNVGMTLGIMPVTGLPMPFISYGGSSLLTYFAMFGLVQSVHMRRMR